MARRSRDGGRDKRKFLFFSPPVTFGDSPLVRGGLWCVQTIRQIQVCRIDYTPTPHKNQDLPLNYRYPTISANAATMEVAGFFMPILLVFATLLKSRFFVIYFRGVTLADGRKPPLCKGRWLAEGKTEGLSIPQSAPQTHSLWCACHRQAII